MGGGGAVGRGGIERVGDAIWREGKFTLAT